MYTKLEKQNTQSGITLLITLLLMGVLLGISTALLNVTLKQFQLSGVAFQSEIAFQAANAAMECALFHHFPSSGNGKFYDAAVTDDSRIEVADALTCFNQPAVGDLISGAIGSEYDEDNEDLNHQRFEFSWGTSPQVCSGFSVHLFHTPDDGDGIQEPIPVWLDGENKLRQNDCPEGSSCAVVEARGYNVPCEEIDDGGRVVEREFIVVY